MLLELCICIHGHALQENTWQGKCMYNGWNKRQYICEYDYVNTRNRENIDNILFTEHNVDEVMTPDVRLLHLHQW